MQCPSTLKVLAWSPSVNCSMIAASAHLASYNYILALHRIIFYSWCSCVCCCTCTQTGVLIPQRACICVCVPVVGSLRLRVYCTERSLCEDFKPLSDAIKCSQRNVVLLCIFNEMSVLCRCRVYGVKRRVVLLL